MIDRLKQNKNAKKDSSHLVPPVNGVGQLTARLGLESGRGWDSGSALRMINMDDDDDDDGDGDGDDVFLSLYTFVSKRECEKFTWGILL